VTPGRHRVRFTAGGDTQTVTRDFGEGTSHELVPFARDP
jgi:hypothetical protein